MDVCLLSLPAKYLRCHYACLRSITPVVRVKYPSLKIHKYVRLPASATPPFNYFLLTRWKKNGRRKKRTFFLVRFLISHFAKNDFIKNQDIIFFCVPNYLIVVILNSFFKDL